MSNTGMTAFCGTEGCRTFDSLGSSAGTVLGLSAAVGSAARCRNTPADVRKVQTALNRFTPLEGGPSPALVVDGKFGPLTLKGITGFQKKHFGLEGADGVVDPDKRTDKALCTAAGTYADLPAEMQKHRARAMHIINLARMSVDRARYFKTGKPNTWGIGKSDWEKAAKHFQIDKFPGPAAGAPRWALSTASTSTCRRRWATCRAGWCWQRTSRSAATKAPMPSLSPAATTFRNAT
jgi:hypothetical protein